MKRWLILLLVLAGCGLTNRQKAGILDVTADAVSAGSGPMEEANIYAGVGMNAAAWILRLVAEYLRRKDA